MAASYTVKSATYEDQLMEYLEYGLGLQTETVSNPQNVAVFTNASRNFVTGQFSVTVTLPVGSSINATTGLVTLNTQEVFV